MANEKRLIYLEDAKTELLGWETDPTDDEIEYTLDSLPKVDAVEVVRCKDCKHYNVYRLECHNGRMNGYIGIDGFCSYGERKDNERKAD